MSVEIQQNNIVEEMNEDQGDISAIDNDNINNDELHIPKKKKKKVKKQKYIENIDSDSSADRHVSPSPSQSPSSTSLDNILARGNKSTTLKPNRLHPLRSSYSEWINNWFSISIPAIGFLGCQLSLALQNGFVTPELEELGISEKMVAYCWLAPPLTGTIVQPLIGITSDMMDSSIPNSIASKYGRRRPFVALGCCMVVLCLLLFSNARYIGLLFGDNPNLNNTSNAAVIAIISFWFLDISINIVQAPLRALISDIIPSAHHTTANGIFGFANGLGAIIGYALGYGMAYNPKLGGGLSSLFALAAFTVIICSVIMLYLTRGEVAMDITSMSLSEIVSKNYAQQDRIENSVDDERVLILHHRESKEIEDPIPEDIANNNNEEEVEEEEVEEENELSKFDHIKEALRTMPKPISRAFMVQFWLYFGLFASYIYLTDWFGKKVTHGDPNSSNPDDIEAYRTGVRIASIGLSFGAIIAVIGSMILPYIIGKFGYRWTWFVCMIFYGSMLLMTPFCDTINMGLIIVTCLGVGQAAAMVIGWSIVTETVVNSDKKGVYTTLFTTSHTIPELTVALVSGGIIHIFDNKVSSVLAVGGVAALFGANAALYIVEPKKWLAKQKWLKKQKNKVRSNRQNG